MFIKATREDKEMQFCLFVPYPSKRQGINYALKNIKRIKEEKEKLTF
jgi:hypothetical protein